MRHEKKVLGDIVGGFSAVTPPGGWQPPPPPPLSSPPWWHYYSLWTGLRGRKSYPCSYFERLQLLVIQFNGGGIWIFNPRHYVTMLQETRSVNTTKLAELKYINERGFPVPNLSFRYYFIKRQEFILDLWTELQNKW